MAQSPMVPSPGPSEIQLSSPSTTSSLLAPSYTSMGSKGCSGLLTPLTSVSQSATSSHRAETPDPTILAQILYIKLHNLILVREGKKPVHMACVAAGHCECDDHSDAGTDDADEVEWDFPLNPPPTAVLDGARTGSPFGLHDPENEEEIDVEAAIEADHQDPHERAELPLISTAIRMKVTVGKPELIHFGGTTQTSPP